MPATKIQKTVISLARFAFKGNGTVVHHVRTVDGTVYIVTLNENGPDGCYDMSGTECEAHQYGHTCYHVKGVRRIESERTSRLTPTPAKRPISEAPITNNEGFSMLKRTR